jgi:hypothetical protein
VRPPSIMIRSILHWRVRDPWPTTHLQESAAHSIDRTINKIPWGDGHMIDTVEKRPFARSIFDSCRCCSWRISSAISTASTSALPR